MVKNCPFKLIYKTCFIIQINCFILFPIILMSLFEIDTPTKSDCESEKQFEKTLQNELENKLNSTERHNYLVELEKVLRYSNGCIPESLEGLGIMIKVFINIIILIIFAIVYIIIFNLKIKSNLKGDCFSCFLLILFSLLSFLLEKFVLEFISIKTSFDVPDKQIYIFDNYFNSKIRSKVKERIKMKILAYLLFIIPFIISITSFIKFLILCKRCNISESEIHVPLNTNNNNNQFGSIDNSNYPNLTVN